MCETSKSPARLRVARCSPTMPAGYWIGISQPANATIFAPAATWRSTSGVRESPAIVTATLPQ
jgi:hypothetical protein